MAEISYYAGGPWGTGDGFVELNNQTITQTMYLAATNDVGLPATRCRLWFAGNGIDAYQVQSSVLQQGATSVSVTINGQSSFLIPAMGRWSDYIATTSFTLPGNVTFVSVVKLKVPMLVPITGGGDDTPTGPSAAGGIIIADQRVASESSYLVLDYTGTNGATSFTESVTGLVVVSEGGVTTDPVTGLESGYDSSVISSECRHWGSTVLALTGVSVTKNFYYDHIPNLSASANFALTMFFAPLNTMTSGSDNIDIYIADGNGNSVLEFVLERYKVTTKGWDVNNSKFINDVITSRSFLGQEWVKLEMRVAGTSISMLVDDVVVASGTATISGIDYFSVTGTSASYSPAQKYFFDSIHIDNAGQPDIVLDAPEVTSTGTITVSDNTLIESGDTITITETNPTTGQVRAEVYTFADTPTGAENEILIGSTATITAANIADAIGDTVGAEFTATSSSNVVTWIKTTSDTVTQADTSDGITVSAVTQSITYSSASEAETLPAITASGSAGTNMGAIMAPLNATGAAEQTGNNGSPVLPAFTSSGIIYQANVDFNSSDAAKIALLLYEDEWMEWFASLVAVPGDNDDVALVATQWVATNITYTTDTTLGDWNDARHTAMLGTGDCEDGAFLLAAIIINSGVDPDRVRVYVGETEGSGHGWVMYQRDIDNQWIVLDWTEGSTYWDAVSDIQDLDPLYPDVRAIVDAIEEEAMGAGEAGFYSDEHAYGEAWEYITHEDVVTVGTTGEGASGLYADSLYEETNLVTLAAAIPAIKGGLSEPNGFGGTTYAVGYGGWTAAIKLPAVTLTATGKADIIGDLAQPIPSVRLSATGHENPFGSLSVAIPAIRLSATGTDFPIGSLARPIPAVTLTASAIAGIIGNLTKPIPSVELAAAAWWLGGADLSKAIPAVKLTAHARAAAIVALAINMKNFGLSTYTNYDYNSLCMFNGKLVGATRTGIYELEGSDDEGTAIPWKIRTGKLDIKTSRLRHVWLSGTISGDIKLIVETAEGDRYEYDAEPVSESEDEIRVKVGKGIASKYVIIELQNESDQTITLDKMQVYGMPKER